MQKTLVYVGSPFWDANPHVRRSRVRANVQAQHRLTRMKDANLFYYYFPLVYTAALPFVEDAEKYWLEHSLAMLSRSDMLFVFTLPGWEKSKGLLREIELARSKNLPIYELTPDTLTLYEAK